MLPKANRLTKKKDFDIVFKNGQSAKQGFLVVKMQKTKNEHSRFGIVVSKKISTKATVRNKLKRRLRDSILKELPHIKKPFDVILITLPGLQKNEFTELEKLISLSFKKLKLI